MSEERELINAISTLKSAITDQSTARKKRDLNWIYTLVVLVTLVFGGFAFMIRKVDQIEKNTNSIYNKVEITDFNSAVRSINYNFRISNLKEPPYIIKELKIPNLKNK